MLIILNITIIVPRNVFAYKNKFVSLQPTIKTTKPHLLWQRRHVILTKNLKNFVS